MKLYTTFTPSHRVLYENYFIKTLPKEFDVQVFEDPEQSCPTGNFYSNGWDKTCFKKIEIFYNACKENQGEIFFYCDVDVQFFDKIVDQLILELGESDIACQDDITTFSSGVFVCRANERTLKMFDLMRKHYDKEDQTTLNNHIHMCNHRFLSKRFFTFGHIVPRPWAGERFHIPNDILVHHANWVVGVENKMKIMDFVRGQYEQLKNTF
jgi:hypothetical protein